ncbi:MAG: iron export ABC transporter permease subunit FetB [Alphaproteobacteria bacterium]|nr:iron export ABC transporter permease subunit FetB [Alphaproteobacteria bacterium]
MSYIELGTIDVALAALLLIVNAGLSIWLRLGLAWQIAIAGARMVVQLVLLGLVLNFLFTQVSPAWTLLAAAIMVGFAGYEVTARQRRSLSGLWTYGIGTTTMLAAAGLITVLALTTMVRPEPWYDPRYALPLLGMILGNAMTGIALGLNALFTMAAREQAAIEARLCLGADRWTALHHVTREALRSGMIPILNSMAATGVVAIPGMMTGQVLAGVAPLDAVKYQLLIMFLIAGVVGIGTTGAVYLGAWRLTDERHRLRLDRLRAADSAG